MVDRALLILDERTTDFGISTLNILEDFLDSFIGVVVVVSHDRYFLDRICNKVFSYKGNGIIKTYNGNYSDYQIQNEFEKINKEKKEQKEQKVNTRVKAKEQKPKFSFNEAKEYEEIEGIIEKLEDDISRVEEEMVQNSSSYGKLQELSEEKEKLEEELLFRYERYEYLQELERKIEDYRNNK